MDRLRVENVVPNAPPAPDMYTVVDGAGSWGGECTCAASGTSYWVGYVATPVAIESAQASQECHNSPVGLAIDGKGDTRWSSCKRAAGTLSYIELTLAVPTAPASINVRFESARPTRVNVYGLAPGESEYRLMAADVPVPALDFIYTLDPATTFVLTTLKMESVAETHNGIYGTSIWEVNVYGAQDPETCIELACAGVGASVTKPCGVHQPAGNRRVVCSEAGPPTEGTTIGEVRLFGTPDLPEQATSTSTTTHTSTSTATTATTVFKPAWELPCPGRMPGGGWMSRVDYEASVGIVEAPFSGAKLVLPGGLQDAYDHGLLLSEGYVLYYTLDPDTEAIAMALHCDLCEGWMAFGIPNMFEGNRAGSMVSSHAIIGTTCNADGLDIAEYELSKYHISGVTKLADNLQTLTDTACTVDERGKTFYFTRPKRSAAYKIPVEEDTAERLIWAVGESDVLAKHATKRDVAVAGDERADELAAALLALEIQQQEASMGSLHWPVPVKAEIQLAAGAISTIAAHATAAPTAGEAAVSTATNFDDEVGGAQGDSETNTSSTINSSSNGSRGDTGDDGSSTNGNSTKSRKSASGGAVAVALTIALVALLLGVAAGAYGYLRMQDTTAGRTTKGDEGLMTGDHQFAMLATPAGVKGKTVQTASNMTFKQIDFECV
jgi:hypothetical protein